MRSNPIRFPNRLPHSQDELVMMFWRRVEKTPGCWLWKGAKDRRGYSYLPLLTRPRRQLRAHRFSYELHNGPIPAGAVVCHACDNPECVNPAHLFVGRQADNVRDMIDKGRQRFPLGTSQWNAKVTPEIVRAIRKRREEGASYRRLVDGFGMSQTQISRIVRGESWRWLS